jgi:hypothetical protein
VTSCRQFKKQQQDKLWVFRTVGKAMPDGDVSTLYQVMHFQYAKIIACSAFGYANGTEAKKKNYGFIKTTFRQLSSGKKTWSNIEREDWQLVESDKECAYCGRTVDFAREHIVPQSLLIK